MAFGTSEYLRCVFSGELRNGEPVQIEVRPTPSLDKAAFVRQLRIRSLYDTYAP